MSPITRDLVEFVSPQDVESRPLTLPAPFGAVTGRPLAGSPEAGDGEGSVPYAFELIVLDGELAADSAELGRHGYLGVPEGSARSDRPRWPAHRARR